jgi:ribosomal protein S18 acetylase RimI-like enzyme
VKPVRTAIIRPATPKDVAALGRMGAALARQHHDFDPRRFMLPKGVAAGYSWWLGRELRAKDAVVLVAQLRGRVVGYAYGRKEERDWNALRDSCGGFHDAWVDDRARKLGIGKLLAQELFRKLTEELGVKSVYLMTATRNRAAQAMFESLGWRTTMLEMTRDSGPSGVHPERSRGVRSRLRLS